MVEQEEQGHCWELLDLLEETTLRVSSSPEDEKRTAIHQLFQLAHNLKSGLALAGFEKASTLFHRLEDELDSVRRGRSVFVAATEAFLLDVLDVVRDALERGSDETMDVENVIAQAGKSDGPGENGGTGNGEEGSFPPEVHAALLRGDRVYRIEKLFSPGLIREDFEQHMIFDDIREVGMLLRVEPDYDQYAATEAEQVVQFWFCSEKPLGELDQLFFDPLIEVDLPFGTEMAAPESAARGGIKTLIVEDDFTCRVLLQEILKEYGPCHIAVNGKEAVAAFRMALEKNDPYRLVCLDIMMPEMDGQEALRQMREMETNKGIVSSCGAKVVMTTALGDIKNVSKAYSELCDGYLTKPIRKEKLLEELRTHSMI